MRRRSFLAATAATLALPAVVRAQAKITLRFIPEQDLATLDPHISTVCVTRNHGYMVFDTLFGQDASFNYTPQMLTGSITENDGKLWKLTLRDVLVFRDGTPVLARDCVASISRWGKRAALGDALMAATDELSAPDDKTIQFRLKKPFALLPYALGTSQSRMPAMMPERLANTDPFKPIQEIICSGPFTFVASARLAGSRNVYARFDKYKPRDDGASEWTSRPKIVHCDRVVWTTIPDAAAAAASLQNDEQDWWECPPIDLQPLLRKTAKIQVVILDPNGGVTVMRPNHLQPPFNKPEILCAFLWAIDQVQFMQAIVGDNPDAYSTPLGFFCPHTPMYTDAGLEPFKGPCDYPKVAESLKRAGYAGERVVLLAGANIVEMHTTGDVMADTMKKVGFNVDFQPIDGAAMLAKRQKKDPIDQGGWSAFTTGWAGANQLEPAAHFGLRGNGDSPSSWPGWCVSPELERLRNAWFDSPTVATAQNICRQIQLQAMQDVPRIPRGQFREPTAYRTSITGVLNGFATFWNVRPA